jgi:hypothetical protein
VLFYVRAVFYYSAYFFRLVVIGEDIFQFHYLLTTWLLTTISLLIQCLSSFAGSLSNIMYWAWLSFYVASQLLFVLLCYQWYKKVGNIPLNDLSSSRFICSITIYLLTALTFIFNLIVAICGGAYTVIPLTVFNYNHVFYALVISIVERKSFLTEIVLREV